MAQGNCKLCFLAACCICSSLILGLFNTKSFWLHKQSALHLDSTAAIAPHFWRDITNNSGLLSFQNTESCKASLLFPLHVQNVKPFQLQGGFAPLTPHQGLCPWTPLGALPPDPHYRLALRARHAFRQIYICNYTTAAHCLLLQWNPDWFYLSGTGLPG